MNNSETRIQTTPTPAEKMVDMAAWMELRNITRAARNVSVEELETSLSVVGGQVWQWVDRGLIPEPLVIELGGQRVHDVYGWPATIMHWWLWSNVRSGRTEKVEKSLSVEKWQGWKEESTEWLSRSAAAVRVGVEAGELTKLRQGMQGPAYLRVGQNFVRYPAHLLEAWERA